MELSTSLNLAMRTKNAWNVDFDYTAIDAIKALMKYGYRVFDFNYGDYVRGEDSPMLSDNFIKWAKNVKKFADENGVQFYQAHGHQFEVTRWDEDFNEMMIKRCIECAEIMGVEWLIFHPYPYREISFKENNRRSMEKFDWIIPMATKAGVGICIENMPFDWSFSKTEDIINLCDRYSGYKVGICWDTGHGLCSGSGQEESILKIGSRLKTLHINDNFCSGDNHLMPFLGFIDWREVMHALHEIGYEGTFNYEIHGIINGVPLELREDIYALTAKVAKYIINTYK